MADESQARAEQNARRVAGWLADSAEFEQQGVSEDSLTAAGLATEEITGAVDYLENREEVVRVPQGLGSPPRFLLKPGRGWPDLKEEIRG